jgi:hypothetical protein
MCGERFFFTKVEIVGNESASHRASRRAHATLAATVSPQH